MKTSRRLSGFTLVELIVVLGILILLISLLVPMLLKATRAAEASRAKADLQAIAAGLEAYKSDFGDYPRAPITVGAWIDQDGNTGNTTECPQTPAGSRLLAQALFGAELPWTTVNPGNNSNLGIPYVVGDVVSIDSGGGVVKIYQCLTSHFSLSGSNAPPSANWLLLAQAPDNNIGLGFKARASAGKIYGPYLQIGKFTFKANPQLFSSAGNTTCIYSYGLGLFDRNGRPILYVPASPNNPNVYNSTVPAYCVVSSVAKYDATGTVELIKRPADGPTYGSGDASGIRRMQAMLGDYNCNGYIDSGEIPVSQPYLLWSPGPDKLFGPTADPDFVSTTTSASVNQRLVDRTDDVTNFR